MGLRSSRFRWRALSRGCFLFECARARGSAFAQGCLVFGTVPLPWLEVARRTWRDALDDDVLGLAAQLSYYFFLALFPAILFLLAIASFFPLFNVTDDIGRSLGPFVSPQVVDLIQDQCERLANDEAAGLSQSAVAGRSGAVPQPLSDCGALNRAYASKKVGRVEVDSSQSTYGWHRVS